MRRTTTNPDSLGRELSLTAKARLILAAAWVAATVGIVIVQSAIVLPTFVALEAREAVKDAGRVSEAFSAEAADLAKLTRDWAAWEETWMYVQGDNPGYAAENLRDETFRSLDIHAMALLDAAGRLVWARVIDPLSRREISLAEFSREAFAAANPLAWEADTPGPYAGAVRRGFMRTAAGIMAYVSCPVLRNYEEGPVRGSLIEGRLLTESLFEKLRARTRVSFQVEALPAGAPAGATDDSSGAPVISRAGAVMRAAFALGDARGMPLARIIVERPTEIVTRGRTTLYWSLGSVLVTLAGVVVAISLLLRRTVLDPIWRLTRMVVSIRTTGTFVARLGMRRADEIGTLASNFDAMLDLLSEKTRALSEMAATDELTGIPNRRSILEVLGRESARARRYAEPLAVLMIDIDHFKEVNDTHGHAAGDVVLKGVASTLHSTVRDSDFAGRYGGEEFLAILPHQDERGALIAAERIRRRIADSEMGPDRLKVTVSIGIGTMAADGVDAMLSRADRAMYAAKAAGRNRVSAEERTEGSGS
jgi:diguanylate cyclase (GGDEF)-like protein